MNSHEIEDPPAAPFQDTTRREPLSSTPLNNTTTLDSQDPIYSVEAIENRVEQLRTYQDEQVEVRSRSPSIPSTPLNPSCLPLSNNISFNSSFEKGKSRSKFLTPRYSLNLPIAALLMPSLSGTLLNLPATLTDPPSSSLLLPNPRIPNRNALLANFPFPPLTYRSSDHSSIPFTCTGFSGGGGY